MLAADILDQAEHVVRVLFLDSERQARCAAGSSGSLAVLLLWVYYSASIFFLGAEVTRLFIVRTAPAFDVTVARSASSSARAAHPG